MARRGSKSPSPAQPGRSDREEGATPHRIETASWDVEALEPGARSAERIRRVALGLLAALIAARAYWPSEPALKEGAGEGLTWDLAIFAVGALALLPSLLTGRFVYRFAWPDVAVGALMFLTAVSARRAADWRLGVNLAWEWAAMGVAYLLLRWLPRGRAESSALALAMVVTATSVGAYGIYQGLVEIPQLQAEYRRDPQAMQRQIGVSAPADAAGAVGSRSLDDRVLQSTESFGTFGLANSLAGFLVGPLVLLLATGIRAIGSRSPDGSSRWPALLGALVPALILLVCLVLTKSRSGWVGLMVGASLAAWGARGLLPRRLRIGLGAAGAALVGLMVVGGLATGKLDREVLSQSTLSMQYRMQYWRATWAMIGEGSPTFGGAAAAANFWRGVGPGNFGSHYVFYKLPEASEEIQDPHNLFLEVWSTAGIWALAALAAALGSGLWLLLGRSDDSEPEAGALPVDRVGWLVTAAGLGLAMVLLLGRMNLFMADLLIRWSILLIFWVLAAAILTPLWRASRVPVYGLGAAAAATVVHLLAAGGIGFPAIAMMIWGSLALGLNLREARPSGRLREVESRIPAGALAIAWAALVGAFWGATNPFWKAEAALARAETALQRTPPDVERAEAAFQAAEVLDRYSARPWLGHAFLQSMVWEARGARADDLRWKTIPALLLKSTSPPRNPDVWGLHSERASATRDILRRVGGSLPPAELISLRASVVEALRTATLLYPTNSALHARLADASAEVSMYQDAAAAAREALRLDDLTPHLTRKLPEPIRQKLEDNLAKWTELGAGLPSLRP